MKGRFLSKYVFIATAILMLGFVGCKDRDDDITKLEGQISNLKTELPSKIEAVKTELTTALNAKITEVKGEISALKGKLADLEAKAATKAELDAVKKEILEKTVAKEVYEAFVTKTEAELKALKAGLAKAATKQELAEFRVEVATKFAEMQGKLDALDVRVTALDKALADLRKALDEKVAELITKIADLKAELEPRIKVLETVLDIKDGKSMVIEDIKKSLTDQLAKITANETEIKNLKEDLQKKYDELTEADKKLQALITENQNKIVLLTERMDNAEEHIKDLQGRMATAEADIKNLKERMATAEADIKNLKERMTKAEEAINLNIANILTLSRQLKGLTFIPTRGLPGEKTMKLYYFAGDYTADHVIMFRVNPSNAVYGRDFNVESLNYQITTRNEADESVKVDVDIDKKREIKQVGDILYVPVHIKGSKPCKVFGNGGVIARRWWTNHYFHGENMLSENNFPTHVVITGEDQPSAGEDNNYYGTALSLVLTASTNSIEEVNGVKTVGQKIMVKSSEMINTELIPTQIKLAEARDGKGNIADEKNTRLKERLLKFTLEEATEWALQNENNLPNDNKNWNILTWSGNKGQGGVWTPGQIDLNDYVSSFYYPQDGGDLTHKDIVEGDPHRYLYSEYGKAFGSPYTDKPSYAKPVYKFEQMIYKDKNHNIVIGPKGGEGVTHSYAEIVDGHILRVFDNDNGVSIQGVRNKKLIIKVTQINSECKERQPVGYLVIKYTDDPQGVWPDVNYTIDLNHIPYFHKACETTEPVGGWIEKTYADGDAGATFTHKNALLELFTERKFMSPINAPGSYGLSGTINPGDVKVILGSNLQLNGIGEHNMGNIYNIQRRDATVVEGSVKFKAADYNHVNDAENKKFTGVTPQDAFRHVMIRYEYTNHSYVVYVDDHAPAGDYEITYKLENKEGETQHGNVLFLTFKFKVAIRTIKVEHDKNKVNWLNENTIRAQHARIHNSIVPEDDEYSKFTSDEGYRVDLRQAFVLKSGSLDLVTETLPAIGGVNAGEKPNYRPMFEFVQDGKITAAGFEYKRDDKNYLTQIIDKESKKLAAEIVNDPKDGFNYLYIKYSKEGDLLYNYLTQDIESNNNVNLHNVLTKWGKTELMLKDDTERLLPVRIVTDINAKCLEGEKFPNGNYYYIEDFNIKFERALRWAFTTVELTDNQRIQGFVFDFETKEVKENDAESVYRGLFDHAYDTEHGYGNLVHPRWNLFQLLTPWDFSNRHAQARFYGLEPPKSLWIAPVLENYPPRIFIDTKKKHELKIANLLGLPGVTVDGKYNGLDYTKVEESTDGGKTWTPISKDYQVLDHKRRYFNVINVAGPVSGKVYRVAIWQGDHTAITSPLYFRVPVINDLAVNNGLAPADGDTKKEYWMTYRAGHAKVKGYAVFKINPRK